MEGLVDALKKQFTVFENANFDEARLDVPEAKSNDETFPSKLRR